MPSFTCKADVSAQVAALSNIEKTQLPFALAATLTAVARDADLAVVRNARAAFKLRNNWTERGIKFKPADKKGNDGTIQAVVYTDTANRATGAPDYLARQEDGGERLPVMGRQHIAVPTKYLRAMAPGIIPTELRPANLLNAVGGTYQYVGRKKQAVNGRQRLVRGFYFFLAPLKSGAKAIMGRYVTDRRDAAFPFYILTEEVHIRKSQLNMVRTVERIVLDRFDRHWEDNWQKIRLRGISP